MRIDAYEDAGVGLSGLPSDQDSILHRRHCGAQRESLQRQAAAAAAAAELMGAERAALVEPVFSRGRRDHPRPPPPPHEHSALRRALLPSPPRAGR